MKEKLRKVHMTGQLANVDPSYCQQKLSLRWPQPGAPRRFVQQQGSSRITTRYHSSPFSVFVLQNGVQARVLGACSGSRYVFAALATHA